MWRVMDGMKFSLYENIQWVIGELYLIELMVGQTLQGDKDNELEDQEESVPEWNTEKG